MGLKLRFLLTAAGCWMLAQAGCVPAPPESTGGKSQIVKVAFWGSPEEINIITRSLVEWQKGQPDISVRFEHTPFGGYVSKILTRIAGGAAPDVIATEVDYFVSFAAKGVLEDLTPYIERDPDFDPGAFFPEVLDRFTLDGHLYAIPRDTAPFACVFYNKDMFDAAGVPYPIDDWTWDDLLAKAQALTKKENGRITQYGFYGWAWKNFVYGNGGALVDNVKHPSRSLLDDPASIEGLQFYADLIHRYQVMPTPTALSNSGMGVDMMFATGRLAMFLSGVWETPGLRQRDFRWDVAMFPKNKAGVRRFGTGGSGYCILKSAKNKEAAWEVIKAMTSARGQALLGERGLAQPALMAVARGSAWQGNSNPPENKGMLNDAVQFVVYDPFHPQWREIESKYINETLGLVFNGKLSVETAVKIIVPKINAALENSETS